MRRAAGIFEHYIGRMLPFLLLLAAIALPPKPDHYVTDRGAVLSTQQAKSLNDRATLAFRLAVSRHPSADEVSSVVKFYDQQLGRFKDGSLKAELVAVSEAMPKPAAVDVNELAAWTTVARTLLNLDEAITKE